MTTASPLLGPDLVAYQREYQDLCLDQSVKTPNIFSRNDNFDGPSPSFYDVPTSGKNSVSFIDVDRGQRPTVSQRRGRSDFFGTIAEDSYHSLGAIWIRDGIEARPIEFPKSDRQLMCLRILRSPLWKKIFQLTVSLQIAMTFVETPICSNYTNISSTASTDDNPNALLFLSNGQPTNLCLVLLNVICVLVYFADLLCTFAINNAWKNPQTPFSKPWSVFRLICYLWIFTESLSFLGDKYSPRLYGLFTLCYS